MKVALFDVDGTILNSMGAWENLGRQFLKTKGIDTSKNINNILYPMTSLEAASYLKNHYQLNDSIQEILESFHKDLYNYYANEVQLKDGIIDILEGLKNNGYKLFIASSSTKELITKSFERLNIKKYFNEIFTYDNLRIPKSDEAFYVTISRKIKAEPTDIIVFEDNTLAAKAAKKSGMTVVGIYDKHTRGNLEENVHKYVEKWEDLL